MMSDEESEESEESVTPPSSTHRRSLLKEELNVQVDALSVGEWIVAHSDAAETLAHVFRCDEPSSDSQWTAWTRCAVMCIDLHRYAPRGRSRSESSSSGLARCDGDEASHKEQGFYR